MKHLRGLVNKARALLSGAAKPTVSADVVTVVKPATVKVVIIGNCQSGAISHLLPMLSSRIQVLAAATVDATPDNTHEAYSAMLEEADWIIAQSIKDGYPVDWVTRSNLTALYGGKLIFFTNHFFDGYYPELCYMHDPQGRRHILPGPMADYHYKTVIHAYQQGMDVAAAISLCDDDAFHAENYDHIAQKSLAELATREALVDIGVHAYVAEHYRDRRLFFTFNHPTTHLLKQSCVALLKLLEVPVEVDPEAVQPGEFLQVVSKPVAGPIYREQAMTFDNSELHKGWDMIQSDAGLILGQTITWYTTEDLVEAFYRLYDANRVRVLSYPINYHTLMV